jgi:hypothetical protein
MRLCTLHHTVCLFVELPNLPFAASTQLIAMFFVFSDSDWQVLPLVFVITVTAVKQGTCMHALPALLTRTVRVGTFLLHTVPTKWWTNLAPLFPYTD